MSNTQSPAELIRLSIKGSLPEIDACNQIPGWASDVQVGGFVNLGDAPEEIQKAWKVAAKEVRLAYPNRTLPSSSLPNYDVLVKEYRKEVKKVKKELKKKFSGKTFATPFAKKEYGEGQTLIELDWCQWHTSLLYDGVKFPVHFWSHKLGASGAWRNFKFAKIKIDTEEQLALFA